MGIPTADIVALPAPADDFPRLGQGLPQLALMTNNIAYAKMGIASRQDLLALGERNKATKARLQAAANRVKPKLDLELSLGYDGATSGSSLQRALQTVEMRQEGPDWSTGLTLNYPLGNNTGLGDLAQLLASYRQGALRELELIRTIQKEIAVVCSNLVNIDRELERTDEALTNYTTAVANEQEKYLMGETTLLDLLYIEDRRDNALLSRISILQRAAGSLARLRFETGKLVSFVNDAGRVTDHDLTTLLSPE
jgi:outer membrane protein TolC